MTISTAANISQRCPTCTTSTYQASSTATESTVPKADLCVFENTSSHSSTLLREIPTRISTLLSTDAADDLLDDDHERRQHATVSLPSVDETTMSPSPRTSSDNVEFDYRSELAAITARCAWMEQQWPSLLASIDQNCVVNDMQPSDDLPSAPPSPWPIDPTPETEAPRHQIEGIATFDPSSLVQQSQNLLTDMQQQSQAIRHLTTLSDELLTLMTRVVSEVDKLVTVQLPLNLVPASYPPTTKNSTITSSPAPATTIKNPSFPSTRHPNNLSTNIALWLPSTPAIFPKPAQKTKPRTRMKRVAAKPSVVSGRRGKTKDLRPP